MLIVTNSGQSRIQTATILEVHLEVNVPQAEHRNEVLHLTRIWLRNADSYTPHYYMHVLIFQVYSEGTTEKGTHYVTVSRDCSSALCTRS